MGGAVARGPDEGTAFGNRRLAFCFTIVGVWDDPAADEQNRQWAKAFAVALEPYTTGGVYVNFTADANLVRAAYSEAKYNRLQALKRQYDPANLFRLNQNIAPRPSPRLRTLAPQRGRIRSSVGFLDSDGPV